MFSLNGKIAFITGSSRGIGLGIARALARQGADIRLSAVHREGLDAAVENLRRDFPERRVSGILCDVTSQESVDAAMRALRSQGGLHILVNNAGINLRAPVADMPDELWQRMLDTDVTGVFRVCRAALPLLRGHGGKVINLCSLMSEIARPGIAPYAAAKGAVRQLTRALATEWAGYNIQVNGVAPGFIATDMNRPLMEEAALNGYIMRHTPAKRWGTPDEVGGVAAFLASPAADFITGQILFVDGGFMASL
ncbi:SDR family oxidoreductase [Desulfovibrio sp.]|uniref:SDR family NAD(P)-dependent oxidoreductase n=1 Tax=Desulfovibrio sp. TaxID=885 RepID=UPI0023C92C3D|nr:SDR family oxidoreductase [Desulfovibrio sp.]MDE7240481.1 SDR family oxidoreductase [Desulfovibrio sp.]